MKNQRKMKRRMGNGRAKYANKEETNNLVMVMVVRSVKFITLNVYL
jgi:hypothetical protein